MMRSTKECVRVSGSCVRISQSRRWRALALCLGSVGMLQTALAASPVLPPPKPSPVAPAPVAPPPVVFVPAPAPVIPAPIMKPPQAAQDDTTQADGTSDTTTPEKKESWTPSPTYLPDAPFVRKDGTSGATTPQKQETVKPVGGTPVGLERDPGNTLVTSVQTDGRGHFSFGKLAPGRYALKLSGKDISLPTTGEAKPQAILISLLLPAVQKARVVEHAIPLNGDIPVDKLSLRVALTVGKDGNVTALDWGDGKGPVDPASEGELIPIPEGVQPDELHGALAAAKEIPPRTFRLGWRF